MAESRNISMDDIILHFSALENPRTDVNVKHPLVSVIVNAVVAVLAGAGGPDAISKWVMFKNELLLKMLDLPNGNPRKDVFRRVLMTLQPGAFQACFVNWLTSLRVAGGAATGVEQPIFAVDGRTARRSHDRKNGLGALHSVSVWASDVLDVRAACERGRLSTPRQDSSHRGPAYLQSSSISERLNSSSLSRLTSSIFNDAVGGRPLGRPSILAWAIPVRTRSRRISLELREARQHFGHRSARRRRHVESFRQ